MEQKQSVECKNTSDWAKIKNRLWFALNIVLTCIYLAWRIFFTIPVEYGPVSLFAGILLITVEVLGMFEALVHYYNMHKVENHPVPNVPLNLFPDVDVFITTYSEPVDLLFKTINGCQHMDYPDKSKVHIYLCDDSRRVEMKKLASDMGVGYLDRPDNKYAKAGNLNNAMSYTNSPLIATFDADMIPTHDFLMRCVPYFVDAEINNKDKKEEDKIKIGFIQTPQSFYNPDLFQFNLFSEARIPNEQDYFYKDIQVSRNKTNSVIYGGSNTLLSRAALVDIGGFYTDAITEDFATGILIQKAKYTCYAINEVLASGLSPNDLYNLIQQRVRWARGVISTGRKMHIFFSRKLTLGQKFSYWASVWYWYAPFKRLVYIMSPILFATFGYMVVKCTLLEVLAFWLPMYVSSNISLRMLSRNIRSTKWTSVYETVLFPFMLIPVFLETFGISLKKFNVTSKDDAEDSKGKNFIYTIPFWILIVLSVIGIVNSCRLMFAGGSLDPIVLLFWLFANLFGLVMALFFVQGRTFMRKSERVLATVDCVVTDANRTFTCVTKDFSESGIAVIMNKPFDIDCESEVDIELRTDRYYVKVKAKVVHVSKIKRKEWKYSFQITDMCGYIKQYLQILYDRVPTLPSNLDKSLSSFDDLRLNITKRVTAPMYQNRKMARIPMDVDVKTDEGATVNVKNFNYKYIAIASGETRNILTLRIKDGVSLFCKFNRTVQDDLVLYDIVNFYEIQDSREKRLLLEEWIEESVDITEEKERLAANTEKEKKKEFVEMNHV